MCSHQDQSESKMTPKNLKCENSSTSSIFMIQFYIIEVAKSMIIPKIMNLVFFVWRYE